MLRVYENDLEILVRGVLVDPVRVEHTQVGATAPDALFGSGFQGALILELVDTLICGFA